MLTGKTNTVHSHPNLLLLQATLIAAESGVPACPPRMDSNEQRATQLIAQMRADYKRENLFFGLRNIPSPRGKSMDFSVLTPVHVG
jgi:hypothetical protein